MDANFLACVFAAPPTVLGRPLRPFCPGHAVLLAALKSPFVEGGPVDTADFLVAVWICSMPFEEGRAKLMRPEGVSKEAEDWGRGIGGFDYAKELSTFRAYLVEHTRAPARWQREDAKKAKAPWPLVITTVLMRDFKLSESEAWNKPLQEALWQFASIAEQNGDDSLVSEEERERARMAREQPAEVTP